eukprot:TRINITY_DN9747_c2_g1_i1.p1 TRINITY_DN9747_c2_g1~~TRINITY_DN9747_c2_g1_i1.p1  ORF type:complete len:1147 (-),score=225.93 TRINITY_DN9747_c2_g1_i1:55-3495(-)
MKLPAILLLICIGCVAADSSILGLFQNSKPFPQISISATHLGSLSGAPLAGSLTFVTGEHSHPCGSFDTTIEPASPSNILLTCRDNVPDNWISGMPVFAEIDGQAESILVGYVFSEEEDFNNNVGQTNQHHKRTLDAHETFLQWATSGDLSDISLGVELARNRLSALKNLRSIDAESVCHMRIPAQIRASLPQQVLVYIETPLDTTALLAHAMEDHFDTKQHFRHNKIMLEDDTSFDRFASGHRANIRTDNPVPVWGFIFPGESKAVISRSAAREAEPNEFASLKRSVSDTKIAVVAGKPVAIPSNVDVYQFGLRVAALDVSGGAKISTSNKKRATLADPPSSTAIRPVKTLLYIYAFFANSPRTVTVEQITYSIGNASRYYETSTFGRIVTLDLTVRMVTLSKNNTEYTGSGAVEAEARTLVTDDFNTFDHWTVSYSGCCVGETWAGLAMVGARGMWLRSLGVSVFVHEMGHNLVLGHSNYLDTGNARSVGFFNERDYGNPSDWMGSGGSIQQKFVVPHLDRLQVMPFANIITPVRSGVYRIYAHDTGVLNDVSKPQGMRLGLSRFLQANVEHLYYVEFRNGSALKGVSINLYAMQGYEVRLVNANPMNPNAATSNAAGTALPQGSTFIDEQSNLMITNIGADYTGPTPFVDLDIQFTTSFPGNRAPTGSISGPVNVSLSGNGTFTVDASDADGDELVYTWYSDQTVVASAGAKTATVTIVFSQAGNRTVRCHINDRKGGLFIATYTVSVGRNNQAKPIAIGTVRDDNGQVIQRAHVWTTSGGSYKGAITNSNGVYSISELPTNPTFITLNAQTADSQSCTAQFTNNFNLTTGNILRGLDFVCTSLPRVSISTSSGLLANDTTGTFTLTRTGSTASSLMVPVYCFSEVSGTAFVEGTALPMGTNITIPAGSASTSITIRHLRSASTDRRQMSAFCIVMESPNFIQTSATRASVALAGMPGPDNDHFANARVLSGLDLAVSGSFNNASTEAYEPSTKNGFWQACPSVWFRWSAPGNGFLVMAWNATFTSNVQVYAGDSLDSLSVVTSRWGRSTPLQVPVEQGVDYKIQLFSCNQPTWTPGRIARASGYNMTMSLSNAVFLPPTASPTPLRGGSNAPTKGGVISSAVVFSSPIALIAVLLIALSQLL